jgi:hypothetical protein
MYMSFAFDLCGWGRYAPPITAAMVSKCLSQRPNTVKAVTDCCLELTELEAAEFVVVRPRPAPLYSDAKVANRNVKGLSSHGSGGGCEGRRSCSRR